MQWEEIRYEYPQQWLLIEATRAHSEAGKRILDQLSVIGTFPNSVTAMKGYLELHHEFMDREFYVLHTAQEQLDIAEQVWLDV